MALAVLVSMGLTLINDDRRRSYCRHRTADTRIGRAQGGLVPDHDRDAARGKDTGRRLMSDRRKGTDVSITHDRSGLSTD